MPFILHCTSVFQADIKRSDHPWRVIWTKNFRGLPGWKGVVTHDLFCRTLQLNHLGLNLVSILSGIPRPASDAWKAELVEDHAGNLVSWEHGVVEAVQLRGLSSLVVLEYVTLYLLDFPTYSVRTSISHLSYQLVNQSFISHSFSKITRVTR